MRVASRLRSKLRRSPPSRTGRTTRATPAPSSPSPPCGAFGPQSCRHFGRGSNPSRGGTRRRRSCPCSQASRRHSAASPASEHMKSTEGRPGSRVIDEIAGGITGCKRRKPIAWFGVAISFCVGVGLPGRIWDFSEKLPDGPSRKDDPHCPREDPDIHRQATLELAIALNHDALGRA